MDLEEIGINAGNWVDSAQDRDYWRALVNCGIEPPGCISHGVSYLVSYFIPCVSSYVNIYPVSHLYELCLSVSIAII